MFRALLKATYVDGKVGKLTKEHNTAENHPFKTDYLFKNEVIPKELYVSRLIQQFLIIQAIETQLKNLSHDGKAQISAFFTLTYLDELWRTPGMQKDLQLLDVDADNIPDDAITSTTKKYLHDIKQYSPKVLLAHFLMHVSGFMHGGNMIGTKYIDPSNRLTVYQIPKNQYNFSHALMFLSTKKKSPLALYEDMKKELDENIALEDDEYKKILEQCTGIYEKMTGIYDDLVKMHSYQPKLTGYPLAVLSVTIFILALLLKRMVEFSPSTDFTPKGPM
ncbi:biliverdin-producing heme oxygenase [Legionella hackeliae]|uniref:Heme oxygenase n=1 Tax=Legionella hackeliae TaxID=449 RepID=A0A0A8UQI7_LEGHA|nr:biliverdin-producing heme oxygenase [Legionella hackeliae]KTD13517.1 heme oxygenase [Legionella hackeliae]CEK09362.1 conserved protein of unknown function [Legionella hackeliae]STX49270.1 heme oxygenase [Legionella hackeliae]